MPSFTAKLSSSVKNFLKRVVKVFTIPKKHKKEVFSTVESQVEPIQGIELNIALFEAFAEQPKQLLMVAAFALDEDETEEEVITFKYCEEEREAEVRSVVTSITLAIDAIEESVEICNGLTITSAPTPQPVRPSPLRQIAFTSPHSLIRPSSAAYFDRPLPSLPATDDRITPTSFPLSTSSSNSSLKSSLAPSTPRDGSPRRSAEKPRVRFAIYEPIQVRSDGYF